ncbi:MAG: glutamine--fructose-6-phosphate transaminase (isomerizing) [Oceanospirillaceae bacterium]|nr:glutamine--fructose-6-phosphate transaminase (isomerizing) [Oceanospirillaceae bacterium]
MCGILGFIGHQNVMPEMLSSLSQIQDTDFNSVAVAITTPSGIRILKHGDDLALLGDQIVESSLTGVSGIGHGRWDIEKHTESFATTAGINADVTLVQHGSIDNLCSLQFWLETEGITFSDTPSIEILPQLISLFLRRGYDPEQALNRAVERAYGTFSVAVMFRSDPSHLYAAQRGCPLVLGIGRQSSGLSSDERALGDQFNRILYLKDGDQVRISTDRISIREKSGRKVHRHIQERIQSTRLHNQQNQVFYHREIHEQPEAISRTLNATQRQLQTLPLSLFDAERLTIIASGSSYHAALIAKSWFETYAALPVDALIASEFRYGPPLLKSNGVTIVLSQSGETSDTLQSLRFAREQKQHVLAVLNTQNSSISHEADYSITTQAGPELCTVATKSFCCQLAALANLVIKASLQRQLLELSAATRLHQLLFTLPAMLEQVIADETHYQRIGQQLAAYSHLILTGYGCSHPLALEGALKFKEICHLHAEGIATGELKHGAISLLETNIPIMALASQDERTLKTLTDTLSVYAPDIKPILLADKVSLNAVKQSHVDKLELPDIPPLISPILHAAALQLIAYHTARAKSADMDLPLNLAKPVTEYE